MSQGDVSRIGKKAGRPRSERAKRAILTSAFALLEEVGPTRITVEAVAARAKVGKPTIYRYWANAQELTMAAMMAAVAKQPADGEPRQRRSALDDLHEHVHTVIERFATPRGRHVTVLLASAERDSELFKAFRNQVIMKSRAEGREILQRAVAAGEVRRNVPIEPALDLLYGSVFFRLLVGHEELTREFGSTALRLLVEGIAAHTNPEAGER